MADAYIDISRSGVYSIAANGTREALSSYLYQPEVGRREEGCERCGEEGTARGAWSKEGGARGLRRRGREGRGGGGERGSMHD